MTFFRALARRALIRFTVRRRMRPPVTYRFHADRHQMFRIYCAAAQMNFQQLDSEALIGNRQPTLLVLRSNVEGVRWWKVDEAVPVIGSAKVLPVRVLRPVEATTDFEWSQWSCPAIVIENPTPARAVVDVFYATREESDGQTDL